MPGGDRCSIDLNIYVTLHELGNCVYVYVYVCVCVLEWTFKFTQKQTWALVHQNFV